MQSSTAIVRVPTASSSARSWETSSSEPAKACSASSSASRLSRSRWLVGSSRIRTLAPPVHEDRQRQALALAAAEAVERLLGLLAGEEEAPEQRARLVRRQPGALHRRLEHGRARRRTRAPRRAGRGSRRLTLWPGAQPALGERRLAGERLDQRRLAGPVGPTSETCSPRSSHSSASCSSVRGAAGSPTSRRPSLELEDDAARALGLLEREAQLARVLRLARDRARPRSSRAS